MNTNKKISNKAALLMEIGGYSCEMFAKWLVGFDACDYCAIRNDCHEKNGDNCVKNISKFLRQKNGGE